jgi:hypothetical protein
MISRRLQDNLMAIAMIGVFIAVIVTTLDFGPRARMVPLPVATFGLILMLVQLVWQNIRPSEDLEMEMFGSLARRGREVGSKGQSDQPEVRDEPVVPWPEWAREAAAYGMVLAIVGLIFLLGPLPAVFLFAGGYFLLTRQYSVVKGLVYTVALTLAIYLLFVVALEIQMYHGVLEPLVERFR